MIALTRPRRGGAPDDDSVAQSMAARKAGADDAARTEGGLTVYALSFLAMAVAMAGVAWTTGDVALVALLTVLSALGHLVSQIDTSRWARVSFVIYPAALLAVWTMRLDLVTVLQGGSLLPLAKLLAVILALASFNLKSMRTLLDTLLLSLVALLVASEGAPSVHFAIFLGLYALCALLFLSVASPHGGRRRLVRVGGRRHLRAGHAGLLGAVAAVTALAAVGVFLVIPQRYRTPEAAPLPSRLDLSIGRPPSLSIDAFAAGVAPDTAPFLPSRQGTTGGGGGAGTGSPDAPDRRAAFPDEPAGDGGASSAEGDYASLGYVGEASGDIVMYVRSAVGSYWRGQTLEVYDGRGWLAPEDDLEITLDRRGAVRFPDTDRRAGEQGVYVQSFFLRAPQPDAVFTGYGPGYVVPSSGERTFTRVADAREALRTANGYRVVSPYPSFDVEALLSDRADSSATEALALPPALPSRVRALALAVTAEAGSDYERAVTLERFLLDAYAYDLRPGALPTGGDAADEFLFERRAGYCSQFATAMAVMARAVGLPARVAVGYQPGVYDPLTGVHAVRLQDAHAWVEIKFRDAGWVPFDPTPRPDSPWALDAGYTRAARSLQQTLRSGLWEAAGGGSSMALGALDALFGVGGRALLLSASPLAAGGLLALGAVAVARRRRAPRPGAWAYTPLDGRERASIRASYRSALRVLARKGYPARTASQAPREYMDGLRALGLPAPDALAALTRLVEDALYDPRPLPPEAAQEATDAVERLRALPRLPKAW